MDGFQCECEAGYSGDQCQCSGGPDYDDLDTNVTCVDVNTRQTCEWCMMVFDGVHCTLYLLAETT